MGRARWRWSRRRQQRPRWAEPPARVPDGDTIPIPGYGRWVDLLAANQAAREVVEEHTRMLPIVTPAQRWRGWEAGQR